MRKMGTMMMVAAVGMVVGSANAYAEKAAPAKARAVLRVFGNGAGQIVDFASASAAYERAWETGVLPGASSHGAAISDTGWTSSSDGSQRITGRTQTFADGTVIYRELTTDIAGHLTRVRFYDTHADGARQGFRVDGTMPDSLAFVSAGRTLATAK
jgi:hypothetical protein